MPLSQRELAAWGVKRQWARFGVSGLLLCEDFEIICASRTEVERMEDTGRWNMCTGAVGFTGSHNQQ